MNIQELREICLSLKGVTEDIKWEDHLCFNIGGKMFLVTSPDSVPVTASFKTTDENFNELIEKEGFIPAPYLAKNKWVLLDNINRPTKKEWIKYIKQSYDLIYSKLPAKVKKEISAS